MSDIETRIAQLEKRIDKLEERHEHLLNTLRKLADNGFIHRHVAFRQTYIKENSIVDDLMDILGLPM